MSVQQVGKFKGTCKLFLDKKGYGFIRGEGVDEDIIVHHSEIRMSGFRRLVAGQAVEFELVRTEKGLAARSVVPIAEPRSTKEDLLGECRECNRLLRDCGAHGA